MSPAPRTKSSVWYKEQYDKVLVVVTLVALLGSALFLLVRIGEAQRALTRADWERLDVEYRQYDPLDVAELLPYVERLQSPFQIRRHDARMLVSDLRVVSVNPDVRTPIPYDAEVCPWTQYEQPKRGERDTTGDGIPDHWYVEYGLDPLDATLADRDLDGDGFTVREEYEAQTNPVDPDDHPSHAHKMRVRRVATRPFDLRFQGVQEISEDDHRYMLNVRGEDRSYFARMGDTVRGYTLVDFERRTREGPHGRSIDASVLTLERGDGRQVPLAIDTDVTIDDRVAELVFLVDGSTHRVNVGDTLTLMGNEFNVVDIGRNTVLIHDQSMDTEVTVQRETEADRAPAPEPTEATDFDTLFERMSAE